jgi:hypothetical protein
MKRVKRDPVEVWEQTTGLTMSESAKNRYVEARKRQDELWRKLRLHDKRQQQRK